MSLKGVNRIRQRMVVLGAFLLVVSMFVMPVVAWSDSESYQDSNPSETYGSWDSYNERANEADIGTTYGCDLIFEMTSIPQDGDSYKLHIDYDGCNPGWPYHESLLIEYRWGSSGSWTFVAYCDYQKGDWMEDLSDPTSSIFQVHFIDCGRGIFDSDHTWYFGNEPVLWVYYE